MLRTVPALAQWLGARFVVLLALASGPAHADFIGTASLDLVGSGGLSVDSLFPIETTAFEDSFSSGDGEPLDNSTATASATPDVGGVAVSAAVSGTLDKAVPTAFSSAGAEAGIGDLFDPVVYVNDSGTELTLSLVGDFFLGVSDSLAASLALDWFADVIVYDSLFDEVGYFSDGDDQLVSTAVDATPYDVSGLTIFSGIVVPVGGSIEVTMNAFLDGSTSDPIVDVPEPGTLSMLAIGLLLVGLRRRLPA